ncbi:hypothetical protein PF002_g19641 [Phytophthora fragariae]|uniref:Uncharacterized protein n=2 Tax=Phytophthora fragariae TaxID=53985 RepID=A0A6A3Y1V6_9STRA|nr:hypothetical protein PF002_g19641 [Phytophthora fragariae]
MVSRMENDSCAVQFSMRVCSSPSWCSPGLVVASTFQRALHQRHVRVSPVDGARVTSRRARRRLPRAAALHVRGRAGRGGGGASTISAALKSTPPTAPTPVKNALNQEVEHTRFEHPELASVYPSTTYDPIPELPYADRALKADPTFKNLLQHATVTHLAPRIGTELLGISCTS